MSNCTIEVLFQVPSTSSLYTKSVAKSWMKVAIAIFVADRFKRMILQNFDHGSVNFVTPAQHNSPELLFAVDSTDNLMRQLALLKENHQEMWHTKP